MPNRLLKEGITDSERINSVSEGAEVTFYRLLVVADDLGRMDARTPIVRARCFPLKEQANILAKIESSMAELAKAGLITRYVVDSRPYLQIENWAQRVRSNGKYPPPPDRQLTDTCPPTDGQTTGGSAPSDGQTAASCGSGLGMGKGMGASNQNQVLFDAAAGTWTVPEILQNQWLSAYPAVNVKTELSGAAAWLLANPKNQKSNYARFLTNWLCRAQDKAARVGGGGGSAAAAPMEPFV